jgi:UDP-N-acetylmuramoyl-L-alanyl-D-glutamate--2,6-diaminopimelate ligase
MLLLPDLLQSLSPAVSLAGIPAIEVTGVTEDSRAVQPGHVFVARGGTVTDGSKYVDQAVARGAVAVVAATRVESCPVVQVTVPDAGAAASVLAHAFHGQPSLDPLRLLGVTGTNGKTTVGYLLRHVLNGFGLRCGLIGTVEVDDGRTRWESTMTTPAAADVASLLARMRDRGCRACAMEVSSHSLHQGRVAGATFAGAAFTNLTGDHLDYHGSMDAYAAAKATLFAGLSPGAVAAINGDDPWADRMVRDCAGRVVRYGFGDGADYRAADLTVTAAGSAFDLHAPHGRAQVSLPLVGRHNVENAMAAAVLLGEVFQLSASQLATGLSNATGAPGRLQSVRAGQRFAVLVDYAHTDDALRNVLTALRPLCAGRLRVVFGCGGDRDRTKRPRMARVAEQLADDVYLTSDNPRTEDPASILAEVAAGFTAGRPRCVEADRRTAIVAALSDAGPDDVVLVAGKGHENYQIVGTVKHHFDDVEECERALGRRTAAA